MAILIMAGCNRSTQKEKNTHLWEAYIRKEHKENDLQANEKEMTRTRGFLVYLLPLYVFVSSFLLLHQIWVSCASYWIRQSPWWQNFGEMAAFSLPRFHKSCFYAKYSNYYGILWEWAGKKCGVLPRLLATALSLPSFFDVRDLARATQDTPAMTPSTGSSNRRTLQEFFSSGRSTFVNLCFTGPCSKTSSWWSKSTTCRA